MVTLRERLRRETRSMHERLEARLALVNERLDLDRYLAVMAAFHGFYAGLAARWVERDALEVVSRLRQRLEWLDDDLAALGISPAPPCERLPPVETRSERLGCSYVIEGSSLGGRLIRRYVVNHLQLCGGRGAAFFGGPGDDLFPRWRAFLVQLRADERSGAVDADRVVASAAATFASLESWLDARGALLPAVELCEEARP